MLSSIAVVLLFVSIILSVFTTITWLYGDTEEAGCVGIASSLCMTISVIMLIALK